MALTPVELRHARFARGFRGYRRGAVDELLSEAVESFEAVWRERADLADKVEQVEQDLVRYRELETLLRTTLVSAERAAQELKEQAARQARLVIDEAHAEARSITHRATAERERLVSECRRLRAQLRSALETLAEPPEQAQTGADGEPEPHARAA